ncbi:alpha/beta hydrolase [Leifsonia xyli]|uniref:alpha/beta hydrolase n=1 Tax=Leifsonia xyli TaxID=1575 RepID=UPI003D67D82D
MRRVLACVLCLAAAAGITVFSPSKAPLPLAASSDALSLKGLKRQSPQVQEWVDAVRSATPEQVAEEWSALPAEVRPHVTAALPVVAGNLDGLPYRVRDRLNRRALAQRLELMKKRNDEAARTAVKAYEAIAGALRPRSPRRYLMSLTGDLPPLAAISVGDPDAADMVTWQVPGMGTYSTDMKLWALAAQNVWDVQGTVGAPKKRAVIAWMGYTPPPPPPSIEASRGEYARAGAPNLIRDMTGLTSSRGTRDAPIVNVVAHSYGTTTAANALARADLGVNAFVMLGSAGIETSIPRASDLHARAVYVSEARKDGLAGWGRLSRIDPRAPRFGAIQFGSDGYAKQRLRAVTGHAPILHSAWNDKITSSVWTNIVNMVDRIAKYWQHRNSFGYLDRKTESLANVASATAAPATKRALTDVRR